MNKHFSIFLNRIDLKKNLKKSLTIFLKDILIWIYFMKLFFTKKWQINKKMKPKKINKKT